MDTITQIEDLFRYNDWANGRVFELCKDLTHEQADQPRELGLGSLRNTLFHILAAEQIWLERWQTVPWRPFPTDSQGMGLDDIEAQLKQISQARFQLIKAEKANRWQRIVNYKDGSGKEHSNPLDVLLMHVANHSVYHRAQALAYLKSFGRTLPVGIDYLLYKLARPTLEQDPESVTKFKAYGLQVNLAPGWNTTFDPQLMKRYFEFGRWATQQILQLLDGADDVVLDRDFGMGPGSIRKTLIHMLNVEHRWSASLRGASDEFQPITDPLTLSQLASEFSQVFDERSQAVESLNEQRAQEIISASPGGIPLKARVLDALVQVCCHGTHHRAQLVNMLRHSGRPAPSIDLISWWRLTA